MSRFLAGIGLVMVLVATSAEASRLVVLVVSHRLFQLGVRPTYLLPDGAVIDHDRIVRACAALRLTDWVVYDPASESCLLESEVLKSFRPPARPEASGIVAFDTIAPAVQSEHVPGARRSAVWRPGVFRSN